MITINAQATTILWRKKRKQALLLSQGESACGASATPSSGEHTLPRQAFIVFLRSYIIERFIIYYIEQFCLHSSYNQGNKNSMQRGMAISSLAVSLGELTQALEVTLKINNIHLLL
jgi:hypothetical protein